jgi:hypothetical protein
MMIEGYLEGDPCRDGAQVAQLRKQLFARNAPCLTSLMPPAALRQSPDHAPARTVPPRGVPDLQWRPDPHTDGTPLQTPTLTPVLAILATVLIPGCAPLPAHLASNLSPQRAFFEQIASRCGDQYPGRAIIAPDSDDTFRPAFLAMRIDSCRADEIRIAFLVDQDESRTWVLTMDAHDLIFTHEHLLEGDTLSSNSGWGGRAVAGTGTPVFQHFPDHRWDSERTPAASRSHWRMRIDVEHAQFVYYLDRGATPAYRLVFHMGQDPALVGGYP